MSVTNYYQYQLNFAYPIFLRFESEALEGELGDTLKELGFFKLDDASRKKVDFSKFGTKVLKIGQASPKVTKQIKAHSGMDQYGHESLTPMGGYDVYRYRNVAMLMIQEHHFCWELGLILEAGEPHKKAIKIVLNRFLSYALAPLGVVGFWGTLQNNAFLISKSHEGGGDAFFIDTKNKKVLASEALDLFYFDQIIRTDASLSAHNKLMAKEELIGFLGANTTYMSYRGLDQKLRQVCYDLASVMEGVLVPLEDTKALQENAA